ncbi:MAG: hypothetical protein RLY43_1358 [Bacteroidota bacterium]
MTRTAVAMNATTRTNSPPASVAVTKTTIDSTLVTNGVTVTDFFLYTDQQIFVDNTAVTDQDVTIQSGDTSIAVNAGSGDKVVTVTASTMKLIDNVEGARFKQSGDDLYIDFESGTTGYLWVTGKARGIG